MKKTIKWLIVPVAACCASTAFATETGFYAGLGAGESHYKSWASTSDARNLNEAYGASIGVDDFDGMAGSSTDQSAIGFKVFAGYALNHWLAVEASYLDAGEVDAGSTRTGTFYDPVDNSLTGTVSVGASAQTTAAILDAVVGIPVGQIEVFGKAGVYSAQTKLKLTGTSTIIDGDYRYSDRTDASGGHYGIGIRFAVKDAIGFRAEWERLYGVEANDAKSDVDLLSASLTYQF